MYKPMGTTKNVRYVSASQYYLSEYTSLAYSSDFTNRTVETFAIFNGTYLFSTQAFSLPFSLMNQFPSIGPSVVKAFMKPTSDRKKGARYQTRADSFLSLFRKNISRDLHRDRAR